MSWGHRVLHHEPNKWGEEWYAIHEVHYNDEDRPVACTTDPVAPGSETLEGLVQELEWMLAAAKLPVLEYAQFTKREKGDKGEGD